MQSDLLKDQSADDDLSHGSELNDPNNESTGVEEESSVDTDNQRYNGIPPLQDVLKVNKESGPLSKQESL